MQQLEFELEVVRTHQESIVYRVKRKGYDCGLLWLEEPYNLQEARSKELILK